MLGALVRSKSRSLAGKGAALALALAAWAPASDVQAAVVVTVLNSGVLAPPGVPVVTFNDRPASNNGVALGTVTLGGIHFSGDAFIFTGTKPGISAEPYRDRTPYLSVLAGGSEMLQLEQSRRRFGLFIGSLDSYNFIDFYRHDPYGHLALVASFSGTRIDALTPMIANGDQFSNRSNRYVNFTFSGPDFYDTVVLRSTRNAFEVDNISAPIPEPATWVMMLMGFAALGYAARRRESAAKAAG